MRGTSWAVTVTPLELPVSGKYNTPKVTVTTKYYSYKLKYITEKEMASCGNTTL